MPTSKRVADLTTTQTFSHKTLDSTCTFESLLQSYATAGLPTAALTGRLAWLTDGIRGVHADTGSQWVAVAGEVANVRNFGATGLGVSSDAGAIQAAVATGFPVYFPHGTYLVDATLPLSFSGQTFYGDGGGSIIRATNPNVPLWKPTEPVSHITWQGLRFEGAATDTSTVHRCIETEPGSPITDATIFLCQFSGGDSAHGFNWAAVANTDSHRWTITHTLFERLVGSSAGYGYAFIVGHANGHVVAFNTFIGTPGRGRHAVYLSGNCSQNRIIGNTITNFNFEHLTQNSSSSALTPTFNVYMGNICVGGGEGGIDGAAIGLYGKSRFNMIAQNIVRDFYGNGIFAGDVDAGGDMENNVIVGNIVDHVAYKGIMLIGAKRTVIENNLVWQASQDSPGTHAGIDLRSFANAGTKVTDMTRVVNNISEGDEQRCGFNIDPTSPRPTNTVLKGNVFGEGMIGNGYQLNGAVVQIDGVLHQDVTYSSNMSPTAPAERETINRIVATNTSAFTINTPSGNEALAGKLITLQIYNDSGGSLGTATFNGYHLGASWTQPADNKNRSITFRYDGNGWAETYRSAADVATP